MGYPSTIAFDRVGNNGICGPYLVGSADRYVILQGDGVVDTLLHAYKSTDRGLTWAEFDAAHAPDAGNTTNSCCFGNDRIFAVSGDATGVFMQVSVFNTLTKLWESSTVLLTNLIANPNDTGVRYRPLDGKLVVSGSNLVGAASYASYFIFDPALLTATVWTNIGNTPGAGEIWYAPSVLSGSGRSVFIIYVNAGATRSIYQQALGDTGSLGTLSLVQTVTDLSFSSVPSGSGSSDGTTLSFAWQKTSAVSGGIITVLEAPVVASDILTFSSKEVTLPNSETISSIASVVSSSGVYLFTISNEGDNPFRYFLDTGSGFDAGTFLGNLPSGVNLWGGALETGNVGLVISAVEPNLHAEYWETLPLVSTWRVYEA